VALRLNGSYKMRAAFNEDSLKGDTNNLNF